MAGYQSPHNQQPSAEAICISLRPYNLKELAALYGISRKTLLKWLRPFEQDIGKRIGYYYTIPQVRTIFNCLDFPSMLHER
jgi:hypothetical protein